MAHHTPGPWVQFADKGRAVAVMPAMRPGEICSLEGANGSNDVVNANARLISAAPAMLEALKLAEDMLDDFLAGSKPGDAGFDSEVDGEVYEALIAARSAIALAEGGAASSAAQSPGPRFTS